jgi:tRNA-2-methylthio-N6-dimethylallyladenosine synthase
MNEYDTEIVKTILKNSDFILTDKPEEAAVILLNTCSVRENAHDTVYRRLHVIKKLRRKNKNIVVGILGCMAQNLRKELLDSKIGVDLIAGPDSYKKLPAIIRKIQQTGVKDYALTLSESETYSDVFPVPGCGVNAWLAVMRGCDNFCTFCVVPYTRGRERSRDPQNVIEEVKKLAELGYVQITLLGQNVNSYRYENYEFADLLEMVGKVAEIRRIRFMSPHPKDFPERLIEVVAGNAKACKHIHLPAQSGNDRILELMNRTYTGQEYIRLCARLREKIPGLVLTTDIIVGFPTESEQEFQDTMHLLKTIEFDAAFTFKYSERKNTIAERKYPDDVSEEIKTSRITRLVDLQRKISYKKNQQELGRVYEVLVEGTAKRPDQLIGRNDGNKLIAFAGRGQKTGDFVKVKIEEVTPNTLIGTIVKNYTRP